MELWKQGAVAFIGPEDSCQTEAMMAASINLPMISYVSFFIIFPPTFSRHLFRAFFFEKTWHAPVSEIFFLMLVTKVLRK